MAILKVARMGHPVLRAKARTLSAAEIRSAEVQRLIDDMFDTMREYQGVGLAAPQVHVGVRLFVAGFPPGAEDATIVIMVFEVRTWSVYSPTRTRHHNWESRFE